MEKIIVQITGGFGNQLFQYAVAKAIAVKSNLQLKLDLGEFEGYKLRKYELGCFNVEENFATPEEVEPLKKKRIFKKTFVKEREGKFAPKVLKLKRSAYLKGFWQSEKYFKDISDVIKKEFTFKNFDFVENHSLLEEIGKSNSVAVSFRCGDYINDPETAKIHNVCSLKYYEDAINHLKEKLENPVFYVFSDDMGWVAENFKTDVPIKLVDTANWQEAFYFRQKCKHHIVANSSFAWWPAWLSDHPDKMVIAPSKWYTDYAKINYESVVPENWVKIDV